MQQYRCPSCPLVITTDEPLPMAASACPRCGRLLERVLREEAADVLDTPSAPSDASTPLTGEILIGVFQAEMLAALDRNPSLRPHEFAPLAWAGLAAWLNQLLAGEWPAIVTGDDLRDLYLAHSEDSPYPSFYPSGSDARGWDTLAELFNWLIGPDRLPPAATVPLPKFPQSSLPAPAGVAGDLMHQAAGPGQDWQGEGAPPAATPRTHDPERFADSFGRPPAAATAATETVETPPPAAPESGPATADSGAGLPPIDPEGPAEHIRNALQILSGVMEAGLPELTPAELQDAAEGIARRLDQARTHPRATPQTAYECGVALGLVGAITHQQAPVEPATFRADSLQFLRFRCNAALYNQNEPESPSAEKLAELGYQGVNPSLPIGGAQ